MTPEQIAEQLLEGQRRALTHAYQDGCDRWYIPTGTGGGLTMTGLAARSIDGAFLTPLGLSVRAILEEARND